MNNVIVFCKRAIRDPLRSDERVVFTRTVRRICGNDANLSVRVILVRQELEPLCICSVSAFESKIAASVRVEVHFLAHESGIIFIVDAPYDDVLRAWTRFVSYADAVERLCNPVDRIRLQLADEVQVAN